MFIITMGREARLWTRRPGAGCEKVRAVLRANPALWSPDGRVDFAQGPGEFSHQSALGIHIHLAIDSLLVILDDAFADFQRLGNLASRPAVHDQIENVPLTRREVGGGGDFAAYFSGVPRRRAVRFEHEQTAVRRQRKIAMQRFEFQYADIENACLSHGRMRKIRRAD